jgi:hypothetical protein
MAEDTSPDNSGKPPFGPNYLTELKKQVWEALGTNQATPMQDPMTRDISPTEIYYLLQRWASLAIWDVYNLEPAGDKTLLTLPGASPHYEIFDRGSCLVGAPKDLFSYKRNLEDGLMTARAMADEVYKRGWTVEFAGFNKLVRAAWVELQVNGSKSGKFLEVLHFTPSASDMKLAQDQAQIRGFTAPTPPSA